jgi:hypothetical protein
VGELEHEIVQHKLQLVRKTEEAAHQRHRAQCYWDLLESCRTTLRQVREEALNRSFDNWGSKPPRPASGLHGGNMIPVIRVKLTDCRHKRHSPGNTCTGCLNGLYPCLEAEDEDEGLCKSCNDFRDPCICP